MDTNDNELMELLQEFTELGGLQTIQAELQNGRYVRSDGSLNNSGQRMFIHLKWLRDDFSLASGIGLLKQYLKNGGGPVTIKRIEATADQLFRELHHKSD